MSVSVLFLFFDDRHHCSSLTPSEWYTIHIGFLVYCSHIRNINHRLIVRNIVIFLIIYLITFNVPYKLTYNERLLSYIYFAYRWSTCMKIAIRSKWVFTVTWKFQILCLIEYGLQICLCFERFLVTWRSLNSCPTWASVPKMIYLKRNLGQSKIFLSGTWYESCFLFYWLYLIFGRFSFTLKCEIKKKKKKALPLVTRIENICLYILFVYAKNRFVHIYKNNNTIPLLIKSEKIIRIFGCGKFQRKGAIN